MRFSIHTALAAVFLSASLGCGDTVVEPGAKASAISGPSPDLVPITVERVVTEEEFALADADKNNAACMKETPSANLLLKDANAATPSQPCPPAWTFLGKPAKLGIKYDWWLDEDANHNNQVCVKFVGTDGSRTIVKDDNLATPSQPCPPAFQIAVGKPSKTPTADATDLAPADEDQDGTVCVNATAGGNFIVRDDNNATPSQPCPPAWAVVSGISPGPATENPEGK